SYMLIKQGGFYLAAVLATFYQYCFDVSQTPKDWRTACVIPIYKKGDRSLAANYRPVSLLSTLSKVMESVVRETIFSFWVENKVLKSSQFGFRPEACCSGQLLSYLEDTSHYMDKGNYADSIYVDFCKAFNTVPHLRLLGKLRAAGIKGNLYQCMR
ncbi:MAG: reverse transcriptase domain-containing protein, partial [Pseudomonadota bacterium]